MSIPPCNSNFSCGDPAGMASLNAYQLAVLGAEGLPPFTGTLAEWLLSQRGADATVTVGDVLTGNPGSQATVTNTGTPGAAVLEFSIPRGADASVSVGTVTTLAPGSQATVTGTSSGGVTVLSFGIPKGDKGDAATVAVGTVTTASPGSPVTVTNTGTSGAAVLNFTIPQGTPGAAATVTIGTVTTGAPGSQATVTNTGTSGAAVFNFTIPQGTPGAAATVTIGTVTTGAPGSQATVINSGTSGAAVLNFSIPQGLTGAAATVTVGTVTTGAPGSQATVTNTGTSGAAVLNFTIPQGTTGTAATVAVGTVTTGAPGSQATVTNTGTAGAAILNFTIPQGTTGAAATVTVGTVTTGAPGSQATVTNTGTSGAAILNFTIPQGTTGAVDNASVVTAVKQNPAAVRESIGAHGRRNSALWNFRESVFSNLGTKINIGLFGDSMIGTAFDYGLPQAIASEFGFAGYGFIEPTPSDLTYLQLDACLTWLTGRTILLPVGGMATIGLAGASQPIPADTLKLYYVRRPGGGTFKIQSQRNGGTWVDETGYTNVDSNGTLSGQVITITKGVNDRAAQYMLRVVCLTGTVTVIGGGLYHSQTTGAVISAVYNFSISSPSNNTDSAKNTPRAVTDPILADLGWNLILLSNLDGATSAQNDLPQLLDNIEAGIATNVANKPPSIVLISPPCGFDSASDALNKAQADAMEALALTRGCGFFDNRTWALPVSNAIAQGLVDVGDVHYKQKAARHWPALMFTELGLSKTTHSGYSTTPPLTFFRGGKLRGNTGTGANSYDPQVECEGRFRICRPPNNGSSTYGCGLLIDNINGPTSINDCASIYKAGAALYLDPWNNIGGVVAIDPGIGRGFVMYDKNATVSAPQGVIGDPLKPMNLMYFGKVHASSTATAVTAHATHGTVQFAVGSSTPIVVTNAYVDTNSNILLQVYGTDATLTSARVTIANGSFTITPNAAATAVTKVAWFLIN